MSPPEQLRLRFYEPPASDAKHIKQRKKFLECLSTWKDIKLHLGATIEIPEPLPAYEHPYSLGRTDKHQVGTSEGLRLIMVPQGHHKVTAVMNTMTQHPTWALVDSKWWIPV